MTELRTFRPTEKDVDEVEPYCRKVIELLLPLSIEKRGLVLKGVLESFEETYGMRIILKGRDTHEN